MLEVREVAQKLWDVPRGGIVPGEEEGNVEDKSVSNAQGFRSLISLCEKATQKEHQIIDVRRDIVHHHHAPP